MNIKKKALLFIEKLAKKILSEQKPVSSSCSRSQFIKVVHGLPDGKLKTELLTDVEQYHEELSRMLKEAGKSYSKHHAVARMQPYNLFLQRKKIDNSSMHDVDEESSQQIYSLYVSQMASKVQNISKLKKLLKHCQPVEDSNVGIPVWLKQICKLCAVFSGQSESYTLQITMKMFYDNMSEEDLSACPIARLDALKDTIISFLTYCHLKPEQAKIFSKPSYGSLISSILSLYIEMVITVSRDKNEKDQQQVAKRLCSTVLHFIDPHHHLGLEAIIQVDNLVATDGVIVEPLCRKLLERPAGVHEPAIYTKYIVAGRTLGMYLPGVVDDLVLMLNGIRAPKSYLEWLDNKNHEVVHQLPVDSHFKRTRITRFLLNDASNGIIDGLLDALTEPMCELSDNDQKNVMDTDVCGPTAVSADVDSYCFIDRCGNICVNADSVQLMESEENCKAISNTGFVELDDKLHEKDVKEKEMKQKSKSKLKKMCAESSTKSNIVGNKRSKNSEMSDSVEAVVYINDAQVEDGEVEETDVNRERHLQRPRSVVVDTPVDMTTKLSSSNECPETLGSLGEICRKRRSSQRLTGSEDSISLRNKALVSGDKIGNTMTPKTSLVVQPDSMEGHEAVNVEIHTGSRMLSDDEMYSFTSSSVASPSKHTEHSENPNQELSDDSPSKMTRKVRNIQQKVKLASPGKNTELCSSLQQDSTDAISPCKTQCKLSVNSPLKQKIELSGISQPERFDLFASLQTEDTCDSNALCGDNGLMSSQYMITETDVEGDEITCSLTEAIVLRRKEVEQTTPRIKSPDHKCFSPNAIPESPTRGAEECKVEPRVVTPRRRSSSRTSVDSPMKVMTPEIVEADSSLVLEPVSSTITEELKTHKELVCPIGILRKASSPRQSVSPIFTSIKTRIEQSIVPSSQPNSPVWQKDEEIEMTSTQDDIFPHSPVGTNNNVDVVSEAESEPGSLSKVIAASLNKLRNDVTGWDVSPVGINEKPMKVEKQQSSLSGQMMSSIPDLSKYLNKPRDTFIFQSGGIEGPTKLDGPSPSALCLSSSAKKLHSVKKLATSETRRTSLPVTKSAALSLSSNSFDSSQTLGSRRKTLGELRDQAATVDAESPTCVGVGSPSSQIRKTGCSSVDELDKLSSSATTTVLRLTPASSDTITTTHANEAIRITSPHLPTSASLFQSPSFTQSGTSRSIAVNEKSATVNSVKCQLFTDKSQPTVAVVETVTCGNVEVAVIKSQSGGKVSKLPRPKSVDKVANLEQPSCSFNSSNVASRKRHAKTSSPAQCDSNVRRSARLNSKVTADENMSSSQSSVTSSQLSSPSMRRTLSMSQSSASPSRKRTTSAASTNVDDVSGKRARMKE